LLDVTVNQLGRKVTWSIDGGPEATMHMRQAYALARFLIGIDALPRDQSPDAKDTDEEDTQPLSLIEPG